MVALFNGEVRWIYLCLALLAILDLAQASSLSPATVLKGYFRNANRQDVKGMLRYCSHALRFPRRAFSIPYGQTGSSSVSGMGRSLARQNDLRGHRRRT